MKRFSSLFRKLKIYGRAIKSVYRRMTSHSRVVFLLKLALPSIIALFLGLIIVVPQFIDEVKKFKIDMPTIDTTSNVSFTMDNGTFYGQGEKDSLFSLKVENFKEKRDDMSMLFKKINGKIFLSDGSWIDISTDNGNYKKTDNKFLMTGNIFIYDNEENKVYSDEAVVNLKDMSVYGNKPIKAITSFGEIESQGFDFKKNDKYIFTGKVKGKIDTSKIEKSK